MDVEDLMDKVRALSRLSEDLYAAYWAISETAAEDEFFDRMAALGLDTLVFVYEADEEPKEEESEMVWGFYPVLRVKLDDGAFLPERAHETDAGADVFSPIDFTVPAGGFKAVNTGVHVQTPNNCATRIEPKSGLNVKDGILSFGLIDEGFTGEVVVNLFNFGKEDREFIAGDKISQLTVSPVCYPAIVQVEEIQGGERGDNGYGSTGR